MGDAGAEFGYGDIDNSIAVSLGVLTGLQGNVSRSGLFTLGNIDQVSGSPASPVRFDVGNPIDVLIQWDAGTQILSQSLRDTVTLAIFDADYFVDLPELLGGNTGYVGFTASAGLSFESRDQCVSRFQFEAVPEASTLVFCSLAGLGFAGNPLSSHVASTLRIPQYRPASSNAQAINFRMTTSNVVLWWPA
ncbi:MAG: hypothetical protein U1D30_10995 [Planctomycetota bacterium]